MIQTKRTPGQRAISHADRVVGVARLDGGLETGDVDARMMRRARAPPRCRSASGASRGVFFSGLPGVTSHQTRSSLQPLHREQAGGEMRLMRRIEGAAEQTDPHAGRMRRQDALGAVEFLRGSRPDLTACRGCGI